MARGVGHPEREESVDRGRIRDHSVAAVAQHPLSSLRSSHRLHQIGFAAQDEVERGIGIGREPPDRPPDGRQPVAPRLRTLRHQSHELAPSPVLYSIGTAATRWLSVVSAAQRERESSPRRAGEECARDRSRRTAGPAKGSVKAMPDRGGVFGARPHSAGEVRSCAASGESREGVEGEDHILRGHRLPIMPAGTGGGEEISR